MRIHTALFVLGLAACGEGIPQDAESMLDPYQEAALYGLDCPSAEWVCDYYHCSEFGWQFCSVVDADASCFPNAWGEGWTSSTEGGLQMWAWGCGNDEFKTAAGTPMSVAAKNGFQEVSCIDHWTDGEYYPHFHMPASDYCTWRTFLNEDYRTTYNAFHLADTATCTGMVVCKYGHIW